MRALIILILCLIFIGYITLGGFIFSVLEIENETRNINISRQAQELWLKDHTCVSREAYAALMQRVLSEYKQGVISGIPNAAPNWDLPSSVFFSVSLVTTIGYGHSAPTTFWSQFFCVFYAFLGIPLTFLLLTGVGGKIRKVLIKIIYCWNCTGRCYATLRMLLLLAIGQGIFVSCGALMFYYIDGWEYWNSWYYSFISLTTVGFGDIVPGRFIAIGNRSWYRIIVSIWIIVGLAWLAGVLATTAEAMYGGKVYSLLVKKPKKDKDPPIIAFEIAKSEVVEVLGVDEIDTLPRKQIDLYDEIDSEESHRL